MGWRPYGLGAGIGAFLLLAALATDLVTGWTELSATVGVPLGLVAGVLAIMFSYRLTREDMPDATVRLVAGAAGLGYALLVLSIARWAAAAARDLLGGATRLAAAAALVGLAAAALVPPDRVRGVA